MGDIQYLDETLCSDIQALTAEIEEVRKVDFGPQKEELGKKAALSYKKLKTTLSQFKTEVGTVRETALKNHYQKKLTEFETKVKELDKSLSEARKPKAAAKMVETKNPTETLLGDAANGDFTSETQVLDTGIKVQQDAMKSLARTERLTMATEEIGLESLKTLQKQTESINQINQEMDKMDSNIARAKADVIWFARQLAGDKCFMMLFLFLVLGLCGLVFWKIYERRKNEADAAKNTPAPDPTTGPPTPPPELVTLAALGKEAVKYMMTQRVR